MYQKSIKNQSKMDQKSVKIEVWRAPGQVWRPLGPSWAIQRIFEGILDRLGGVLEASWAGKVANMAPTWPQVGSQVGAKMDKKSIQKSIKKLMAPGLGFWNIFGSILLLTCSYVGAFGSTWLPNFHLKRGGGLAALRRFGSAAPGLVPAHGVQSPIL